MVTLQVTLTSSGDEVSHVVQNVDETHGFAYRYFYVCLAFLCTFAHLHNKSNLTTLLTVMALTE